MRTLKQPDSSRGQTAAKYPLRTRAIAWTILLLLCGSVLLIAWNAIGQGRAMPVAAGGVLAALFAWRNYRQARSATSR